MIDFANRLAVVVIGRNEGERLEACLRSMPSGPRIIYVDSGSTDGSVALAGRLGAEVCILPAGTAFTAALARNTGLARIAAAPGEVEFVQMVDGDCVLAPGWLAAAAAALDREPGLAAVFGRLRERFPERSLYNRMCDDEWDGSVGIVNACGGIAMFRRAAIGAAGGYPSDMIAGEEPELCLRMRQQGWTIRRIAEDMALHDAAMTRFAQWWRRTERGGHAYAELVARHPADGDPAWRREVGRIIGWSLGYPTATALAIALLGWPIGVAAAATVAIAQIGRVARRMRERGRPWRLAFALGFFLFIGKFPQFVGVVRFHLRRRSGAAPRLIEHKRGA